MTPVGRRVRALVLGALLALFLGTALVVADPSAVPAAAAGCGPAPRGRVAVVVVIDHGGGAAPTSRCVVVDHGATGLDALRTAGHQVRLDGGFVCAIDARPTTGCGNVPGNPYWRYWHADPGGDWIYSQVGAGGYRLPARCAVEGWSWSDSPTSRTPPRVAAPRPTCEASPPTTASPVRPAAPVPPAAPATSSTPTGSGAPPAPGASPDAEVAGAPGGGTGNGSSGPGDGTPTTADGADPGGSARADQSDPDDDPAAERPDAPAATEDGDAGGTDEVDGELAADRSTGGAEGGSTPWGVLIAVVLVAGLAGASVVRTRARRDDAASPPA
jgi:hypothetical protein